jgi:hypothetical protein
MVIKTATKIVTILVEVEFLKTPHVETHSFGYWLRLKRKVLDLTHEDLANRVGCSAATIHKLDDEEQCPAAPC